MYEEAKKRENVVCKIPNLDKKISPQANGSWGVRRITY